MAKKVQKAKAPKKKQEDILPIVVSLKPGTAAEKAIRYTLPESLFTEDLDANGLINYGLGLGEGDINRDSIRLQERIREEIKGGKYGISVNSSPVEKTDRIKKLFRNTSSPGGQNYLHAEVIIASRQDGASTLEYRATSLI